MAAERDFQYDVFHSHSAKDKAVVRSLAERLRADGLKVWFDEWVLKPTGQTLKPGSSRRGSAQTSEQPKRRMSGLTSAATREEMIEEWLEHWRVLVLCMSANAFGAGWAQLEAGMCGRAQLALSRPAEPGAPLHSPAARRRPHQRLPGAIPLHQLATGGTQAANNSPIPKATTT